MRNAFSFIFSICLLMGALLASCADVPEFVASNPCDPEYTGDKVCPADVVDTGGNTQKACRAPTSAKAISPRTLHLPAHPYTPYS